MDSDRTLPGLYLMVGTMALALFCLATIAWADDLSSLRVVVAAVVALMALAACLGSLIWALLEPRPEAPVETWSRFDDSDFMEEADVSSDEEET